MKTTLLLIFSALVLPSSYSYAQTSNAGGQEAGVVVTVGTITSPVTSRERVLAYPRLLAQSLNCDVTEFEFTMTANGKTWGPVTVKGTVFNEDVKDKIKETEPNNVKISISNIHVNCSGQDMTARPISLEYNH